jgi:hypothetical protein
MAITRQQSKKMNLKTAPADAPAPTPTNHAVKHKHGIDFIEASKEWRKNKVKLDNCTFEYILL